MHMVYLSMYTNLCYLQKGKHIETVTAVLDCENLSLQKHSYWPGIEMLREVQLYHVMYLIVVTKIIGSFGLLDASICI